jgi:chemotaxis family two-component system response regulator Rcp1
MSSAEILLVEDSPGDIRLMMEAFKEGGFCGRLHVTRDGEEALAFLHREGKYADSPRPSLILLDLNLPRKHGHEVLAHIKQEEKLRRIPVMILSTSTNVQDIRNCYDLHANCYVPKPIGLDALIQLGKLIDSFWFEAAVLAPT